jgi:hypothetical protein
MFDVIRRLSLIIAFSAMVSFLFTGCATLNASAFGGHKKYERTAASYEEAGRYFGEKHKKMHLEANKIDPDLVNAFVEPDGLDFFWVHSDLKEAFKKGYRLGFEDRTADFVLGPHLENAANEIGKRLSGRFVDVITAFEQGWVDTLKKATDVFIVLIAEGSQADRETFITEFTNVYSKKYNDTQARLKSGGFMTQVAESGATLHIDMNKVQGALDIPSPKDLKTEIYHQSFKVMGYEMGNRYSHNLITRNEMIDWMRKSKTALNMDQGDISDKTVSDNLGRIEKAFADSYGTDGENVFRDIAKEAGYIHK